MSVRVRFFASLREQVGMSECEVTLEDVASVAELWALALPGQSLPGNVLAAKNMEYVGLNELVSEGDEVAYFPPVTGG